MSYFQVTPAPPKEVTFMHVFNAFVHPDLHLMCIISVLFLVMVNHLVYIGTHDMPAVPESRTTMVTSFVWSCLANFFCLIIICHILHHVEHDRRYADMPRPAPKPPAPVDKEEERTKKFSWALFIAQVITYEPKELMEARNEERRRALNSSNLCADFYLTEMSHQSLDHPPPDPLFSVIGLVLRKWVLQGGHVPVKSGKFGWYVKKKDTDVTVLAPLVIAPLLLSESNQTVACSSQNWRFMPA